MADFRALLEDLGYVDVRTLLNSGNAVFTLGTRAREPNAARIERALADRLGVMPRAIVLERAEVAAAVRDNPLSSVARDPSWLLVMAFRDVEAVAPIRPLLEKRWTPEVLAVRNRFAYLWCARGVAGSPLWTAVGRAAGDSATARNIGTMTKLLAAMDAA